MDVAARGMEGFYHRNFAQKQLCASSLAQAAFMKNKGPKDAAYGAPFFLDTEEDAEVDISSAHRDGQIESVCAVKHLILRGNADLWKMGMGFPTEPFAEEIVIDDARAQGNLEGGEGVDRYF